MQFIRTIVPAPAGNKDPRHRGKPIKSSFPAFVLFRKTKNRAYSHTLGNDLITEKDISPLRHAHTSICSAFLRVRLPSVATDGIASAFVRPHKSIPQTFPCRNPTACDSLSASGEGTPLDHRFFVLRFGDIIAHFSPLVKGANRNFLCFFKKPCFYSPEVRSAAVHFAKRSQKTHCSL